MIRNNTERVNGLILAKAALDGLSSGTFTTKEYNAIRKKRSTNAPDLLKLGIISIDHIDEFEIEVEIPFYRRGSQERVLKNDAGEIIKGVDYYLYRRAEKAVRTAIDAFYNGGHPLIETVVYNGAETEMITAKRYHYVYHPQKMIDRLYIENDKLNKVVNRKYELFKKAQAAYQKVCFAGYDLSACLAAM